MTFRTRYWLAICAILGIYPLNATSQKGAATCITLKSVTGPLPGTANYLNTCNTAQQLTIQWSGTTVPLGPKVYRFPSSKGRAITMLGTVANASDSLAAFGLGPTGQVSVVRMHTVSPMQDKLVLRNQHNSYTLVDVALRLHYVPPIHAGPGGSSYSSLHTLVVVPPPGLGDYYLTTLDSQVFDGYIVDSIKAEDDPP